MKILMTLMMALFIGIIFTGCFGKTEEYKPMTQVKPEKKSIKAGE
ncbi:MAG: hypothetical protein V2A75_03500 [Pseudomonadota bacterium]